MNTQLHSPKLFPTDKILPYSRNSKQHPKEQVDRIARQISEVGFLVPIVVDKDHVIISGHGRHAAAQALGLQQVPIIVADHLTEDQTRAFRIADNKVAESVWDLPVLAFELGTLERAEIDLTLSGFDMAEARQILGSFSDTAQGGSSAGASESSSGSEKEGVKELGEEGFQDFAHTCPRCGFQWS